MMNNDGILKSFVGKQIESIETDGRFEFTLKCTDGSILTIEEDGCEGSHFKVTTDVRVKTTIYQ